MLSVALPQAQLIAVTIAGIEILICMDSKSQNRIHNLYYHWLPLATVMLLTASRGSPL